MNLILCGMMGAGKTTIGIKIAEITGRRWYDTDGMIVDKHGKISDIFEYYGEAHFRRLETEIVKELAVKDNLVVSTGGGLVLKKENNQLLQGNGKIVFLRATIETLAKRLKVDGERPLLQTSTENIRDRLQGLMQDRVPIYEHVADYVVDVDGKTPEQIAEEIVLLTGADRITK
ncbi:MAG: shikimate kinase [Clostridiales bacterium]|jgi:shikimate kinase|nr:shikimate kinase [Clostridiales bacterium]